MTIPSTSELDLLRTQPHNTKLWLSIYQPDTVFSCQVTGSVSKSDRVLNYYNPSGDYLDIKEGQTLYIGTSSGGMEKGKLRVRSATSSQLTLAENAVNWEVGNYLTIVNFFEITPVFPRIIQNPSDATRTIWYKDYDIAYASQNSDLGSFVCMGSHYAGFNSNPVYFSASGSVNLKGQALQYSWLFPGGTPTGSTSHTPGYVSYPDGHYTASLTVSVTGTSISDTSYRHISIYDRPESGVNVPILNWSLVGLSGGRDQGGYVANLRIDQVTPENQVKSGSLVVIFAEDWYGATKQSIGGNALNRSSIVFIGYILNGTIQYNWRDSYVTFDAGSPSEIMKIKEGFSVSVQDADDPAVQAASDPNFPSGWMGVLDLDMKRAIYHYYRWHSTVLKCCDIEYKGTNQRLQFFDADRTSLFDAVNTLMNSAVLGKLVSDRQGKLWAETDIYIEPENYGISMSLDKRDWMEEPILDERLTPETSYIEAGGIAYDGSSSIPLLTNAPGATPGYTGKVERFQGLALTDQAQLNTIVGNLYAFRNSLYPSLELKLSGNYRNFDIAPQEKLLLTLNPSDTSRGITFTNKPFFIDGLQLEYDPSTEFLNPTITTANLVTGSADSDTLTIPVEPPTDGYDVPEIGVPNIPGGIIITPITQTGARFFGYYDFVTLQNNFRQFIDINQYSTGTSISNWAAQYNSGGFIINGTSIQIPISGRYIISLVCFGFLFGPPDLGGSASVPGGNIGILGRIIFLNPSIYPAINVIPIPTDYYLGTALSAYTSTGAFLSAGSLVTVSVDGYWSLGTAFPIGTLRVVTEIEFIRVA